MPPAPGKLAPITIRLPGDLYDRLARKAGQLDRSRGWIIREALARYLAEEIDG